MNVFSDIFSVLKDHWQLFSGILLMIILGQMLVWSVLKIIFGDQLVSEDYFSLSSAGWILPLSLASLLWLAWGTLGRSAWCALLLLFVHGRSERRFCRHTRVRGKGAVRVVTPKWWGR